MCSQIISNGVGRFGPAHGASPGLVLLAALLCGLTGAGPAAAQTTHEDLETAVPEMVRIEGGCFQMGSPLSEEDRRDNERRHEVCVESFSIGKYEVTRGQYAMFVRATGRAVGGDACWTYESGEWRACSGRSWRSPGYGQEDTHPVVCVSHEETTAYAA